MNNKSARDKFNHLSLEDKCSLIDGYAQVLDNFPCNESNKYFVALYALEGEIVEVFYDKFKKQIDSIWMLSYKELSDYTQFINIKSLWYA